MRRATEEAGESLVELLVAVVILGIAITALITGIGVGITSSSLHRHQADGNTALLAASESIKANAHVTCAGTSDYSPTIVPPPTGWTPTVQSVAYWDGTYTAAGDMNWASTKAQCLTLSGGTPGYSEFGGQVQLQKVTVSVTNGKDVTLTIDVLKDGS